MVRSARVRCLLAVAAVCTAVGQLPQGVAISTYALPVQQVTLPDTRTVGQQGDDARILGDRLRQRAQLQDALEQLQRALALYQQAGWPIGERRANVSLGWVYYDLGRTGDAETRFGRAIDLARQTGAPEWSALNAMGSVYLRRGRTEEALQFHEQALSAARQIRDRAGEHYVLAAMARAHSALGSLTLALDYAQRALDIARDIGDLPGERNAAQVIGITLIRQGQSARALEILEQARALAHAGGDEAIERSIMVDMAWAYSDLSQYLRALQLAQQALAMARESRQRWIEQDALGKIGLTYGLIGKYEQAEQAYREQLRIAQDIGSRFDEWLGVQRLASALRELDRYEEAAELFQQALSITRELGNRRGEAMALNQIGRLHTAQGNFQSGLATFHEALRLGRDVGDRAAEQTSQLGIGMAYNGLRQQSDAIAALQSALAIARETHSRSAEAQALEMLGIAYEVQDDLPAAMAAYRDAMVAWDDVRGAAGLDEFRIEVATRATVAYQHGTAIALRLGQVTEGFELSERGRARAFLDHIGNGQLAPQRPASAVLAQQQQALGREIAALDQQIRQSMAVDSRQVTEQTATLRVQLNAKQREYENAQTQLSLVDREMASLLSVSPQPVGEVQSLLDDDTALLSYFVASPQIAAFVLTRDKVTVTILTASEQELEAAISEFRRFESFGDAQSRSLQQLAEWLIAPVTDQLTTPVVGIVPHGILHYLPFASLPDGAGVFGDRHTLFYLPSASTLRFVQQKRKASADRVLALAQSQPAGFPALRFADVEAESIARLYEGSALTGSAATETAFKAQAGQAPIVHVAAHAELNEHAPLFSRILLAPDGQNDGSLTVQEVYGLDLARADLVVLSACETQLGAQSRGDDVVGLNRAFIYAGAPTVVASLWSVDDEATAVLMTAFYRQLRQGASKAGALQAAQAETRARYSHPYYWAAFVLTGDPGTSPAAAR